MVIYHYSLLGYEYPLANFLCFKIFSQKTPYKMRHDLEEL